MARWGLEGHAPVHATQLSATDSCGLQCNESLPKDLRDLELDPESSELMPVLPEPQVIWPLGTVPIPVKS